jgi:hypothetical protein
MIWKSRMVLHQEWFYILTIKIEISYYEYFALLFFEKSKKVRSIPLSVLNFYLRV